MREGEFHVGQLVKCHRPPRLKEVYQGNHVMLASGGPCMIVMEVRGSKVHCWWDSDGGVEEYWWDIEMLTCLGAK